MSTKHAKGMTAWDTLTDRLKELGEGGSKWLKLKNDGDTAIVAFLGEPVLKDIAFVDNKALPYGPEHAAQGIKRSVRVSCNVAKSPKEILVLEQGTKFFQTVARVVGKFGTNRYYEITRHGAAGSTQTTYTVDPDREMTKEEIEAFKQVELTDLNKDSGVPSFSPLDAPKL